MVDPVNFQIYLEKVCAYPDYNQWWANSVLTDTERQQSQPFDFDLRVRKIQSRLDNRSASDQSFETNPSLPVFEALHQYSTHTNHILLIGRPGSGKTKILFRYLLALANQARNDPSAKIPILIQLKGYTAPANDSSGIVHLIRENLKGWGLFRSLEKIDRYLFEDQKFILLIDGLNEFSTNPAARKDLKQFWNNCCKSQIPVIFSTRSLGYQDLEIETQLEIQPLSPDERQKFIEAKVALGDRQRFQSWLDRAHQADYTPFVMWMLAEVCQQSSPSSQLEDFSLGEAFRKFLRSYQDRLYEDGKVPEETGEQWPSKLQNLASAMMSDARPQNFAISRADAIALLGSETDLDTLIRHHLLVERRGSHEIEFCHQLLQEYYLAKWLLPQLPKLLEQQPGQTYVPFQTLYLNYLKWTEAIALILGFPEITKEHIRRIAELALEVDLILGARLSREIQTECQLDIVEVTMQRLASVVPQQPSWLKLKLLQEIGSKTTVNYLIPLLDDPNDRIRKHTYFTLLYIAPEAVPQDCKFMKDFKREQQQFKLCFENLTLFSSPVAQNVNSLEKISSEAIDRLLSEVSNPNLDICRSSAYKLRLLSAKENAENFFSEAHLHILAQQIEHSDIWVRWYIAFALWNVASENIVSLLKPKLNHSNAEVAWSTALVLGKSGCKEALPKLIQMMDHSNLKGFPDINGISHMAACALGHVKYSEEVAQYLESLFSLIETSSGEDALRAIAAIQSRCGFYNYGIASSPLPELPAPPSETTTINQTFNIQQLLGILNTGTVNNQGDQIGIKKQLNQEKS